jgi:prepilin-type N-terminal cleavage/methylation domain-containing protein
MKGVKRQDGFTLIEVLVAAAILAVIVAVFALLFTYSYSGIFLAGRKSEALFTAQAEMDSAIAQGPGASLPERTLDINFEGKSISVSGKEIKVDYVYEERGGTLSYFLPGD